MNQARAMLDALMGPQRDAINIREKDPAEDWKDKSVCKNFLLGYCPFDKAALGGIRKLHVRVCPKIHSELIRDRFSKHADGAEGSDLRADFEVGLLEDLKEVVQECEQFSKREEERMKVDPRLKMLPKRVQENIDQLRRLSSIDEDRASEFAERASRDNFGSEQNSIMAHGLHRSSREKQKAADELEKAELKKVIESYKPATCEICGTGYMTEDERHEHLNHRVHEEYMQVREKLEEVQKKRDKAKPRGRKNEDDARSKGERRCRGSDDTPSRSREMLGRKQRQDESSAGRDKRNDRDSRSQDVDDCERRGRGRQATGIDDRRGGHSRGRTRPDSELDSDTRDRHRRRRRDAELDYDDSDGRNESGRGRSRKYGS
eukprot:TRINITY_DN107720_c0_g1_i1.p1 TRINITY_DN107720_c0_g1~~TRINITY_DN107720_c0_g1_i1.p1  ORF type:complete len:396 (-),score=76.00 TRINITY_DN107720_c0_g1_i1:108-1232(-)